MENEQFVWVFCGPKGHFPGGIFLSLEKAEAWISHYHLAGVLTRYPLDQGSFDWAQKKGWVPERKIASLDPDFIASFSSGCFDHFHYENGVRD